MSARTNLRSRLATAFVLLGLASGCMQEPPNFGTYPDADDPRLTARVSKAEATGVAELAIEGLQKRDFELWSTHWSDDMRDAIDAGDWAAYRDALIEDYGSVVALRETRITDASADGHVRYSFLIEHERGRLMLLHVYPIDGDEIVGVHLRDADTGEVPDALR